MNGLRRSMAICSVGAITVLATAASGTAAPVKNPNSLFLEMSCGGTQSQLYVSPARGASVQLVDGTQNTVTFALTVNDPLNEIGGSFSFQKSAISAGLLTECTGTVVGTQAVTFTALALVTG